MDDVLNSIMETEAKISGAAESLEGVINEIRGLKDLPSNSPVMNQNSVGVVTNEMARESTNDMSGVLVAVAPKGTSYQKVGTYFCCTSSG